MKKLLKKFFTFLKNKLLIPSKNIDRKDYFIPKYRTLSIEEDNQGNYVAIIQIVNSKNIFKMRPEEILADDDMTSSFSQRDVRTLTYLGYLGINSPKYKVLAKRLSESDKKIVFAIQEKKGKKTLIKTADELSNNDEIINHLHQKDALLVGFTAGCENILSEKQQMQDILKQKIKKTQSENKATRA